MEPADETASPSRPSAEATEKVFRFISDPKHKENLSGRVRAACLNCRRKKIKCSGEENCRICQDRGVVCEGFQQRKRPRKASILNDVATYDVDEVEKTRRRVSKPKQSAPRRASMTSNASQQGSTRAEPQISMIQPPAVAATSLPPTSLPSSLLPLETNETPAIASLSSRKGSVMGQAWPSQKDPESNNWGLFGELDAQGQFGIFDATALAIPSGTMSLTEASGQNDWTLMEGLDLAQQEADCQLSPMQFPEPGLDLSLIETRSSGDSEGESPCFMDFVTDLNPDENAYSRPDEISPLDDVMIQDLEEPLSDDAAVTFNKLKGTGLAWRHEMALDFNGLPSIHIWKQLQRLITTESLGQYDGPLFEWPKK